MKRLELGIWAAAAAAMAGLALASAARAETLGFSVSGKGVAGKTPNILVLDDETGAPVAGAKVTFVGSGATSEITASKEGYAALTLLGADASQVTLFLRRLLPMRADVIGSGRMPENTPQSQMKPLADPVLAGLVFRSVSAFDLLHFETQSFISPLKDSINILGSHDIPSNLVVPDQNIFLLFTAIHIDKPDFRLPVVPQRPVHLAMAIGEISQSDILSAATNGGQFSLDTLNHLKFDRIGLSQALTVTDDFRQDIDPTWNLSHRHDVSVAQPPYKADVLVAAASDMDGARNVLMPTDIKVAINSDHPNDNRTVQLTAPESGIGQAHDVVALATANRGRRMTAVIADSAGSSVAMQEFLDTAAPAPVKELPDSIALPAAANGVSVAVFEAQAPFDSGRGYPYWYVYALPQAGAARVTTTRVTPPESKDAVRSYEVVKLDFGASFDSSKVDGPSAMRALRRFAITSNPVGSGTLR